jgi:hypothetical protein
MRFRAHQIFIFWFRWRIKSKIVRLKIVEMTEVANQVNNSGDKVNSLMKEAENLKQKLEEERQKLNDVTRKRLKNKNNNDIEDSSHEKFPV